MLFALLWRVYNKQLTSYGGGVALCVGVGQVTTKKVCMCFYNVWQFYMNLLSVSRHFVTDHSHAHFLPVGPNT